MTVGLLTCFTVLSRNNLNYMTPHLIASESFKFRALFIVKKKVSHYLNVYYGKVIYGEQSWRGNRALCVVDEQSDSSIVESVWD